MAIRTGCKAGDKSVRLYLENFTVAAEKEQPISIWGQRHLRYLKEYRRATYITLLTSGRLNRYLADVDRQAKERMERLTEQVKRAQSSQIS